MKKLIAIFFILSFVILSDLLAQTGKPVTQSFEIEYTCDLKSKPKMIREAEMFADDYCEKNDSETIDVKIQTCTDSASGKRNKATVVVEIECGEE